MGRHIDKHMVIKNDTALLALLHYHFKRVDKKTHGVLPIRNSSSHYFFLGRLLYSDVKLLSNWSTISYRVLTECGYFQVENLDPDASPGRLIHEFSGCYCSSLSVFPLVPFSIRHAKALDDWLTKLYIFLIYAVPRPPHEIANQAVI